MRGSDSGRSAGVWLSAICLLAFALRLIVIANTTESVLFADMQDYHDRAMHLLETGSLWPDAFRVPLYPIFIAGVFKFFGHSLLAVRIAQAVLGVATVALTFAVGTRVATRRGALAAAFLVAVYPALLLYSVYLMSESLFAFFALSGLALWTVERPRTAFVSGLAIGAAILTRSTGLAVAGGIVLCEAIRLFAGRHDGGTAILRRGALLLAGIAVVLTPWVQRNYEVYGRVIPTDTSSGFNALLGNFEGATGRHPGLPAVEAVAQQYWRTARNDVERSDLGIQAARQFVRDHPWRASSLAARKTAYLYGVEGREHAWGYSFHVQGKRDAATVWAWGIAIMASFPILATLALIGLFRPGLFYSAAAIAIAITLLCVTVLHVASFGDSRFHLPWVPLFAVLAARAFAPITASAWTASRQVVLAVCIVALALGWIDQARELLAILPRLAASPVPLQLPY
jgi:4-amino-4-deoxy-L-arabinose transferase-like glycosyltransferase